MRNVAMLISMQTSRMCNIRMKLSCCRLILKQKKFIILKSIVIIFQSSRIYLFPSLIREYFSENIPMWVLLLMLLLLLFKGSIQKKHIRELRICAKPIRFLAILFLFVCQFLCRVFSLAICVRQYCSLSTLSRCSLLLLFMHQSHMNTNDKKRESPNLNRVRVRCTFSRCAKKRTGS